MTETWLPIPGYEGKYDVRDQGRVRSWVPHTQGLPVPRLLKHALNETGYCRVRLSNPDGRRCIFVHRLVLVAFVGPRPAGMETRHIDGDKLNNRLSNLKYGTPGENRLDQVLHGTHPQARKTHCINGHPYDEENTRRYTTRNERRCMTCRKAEYARYRERQRLRTQDSQAA